MLPAVTVTRREWLGTLGLASASSLLWAMGCGGAPARVARPVEGDQVASWLRDAAERLAGVFPSVQVLAVSRSRATAAIDVLGAAVARERRDGVVLVARDVAGHTRERVTSALTPAGIEAAVRALVGTSTRRRALTAPPTTALPPPSLVIDDLALSDRAAALAGHDRAMSSRIVYAASLLDLDDEIVWSIGTDHDRVARSQRVVKRVIRAAWNGTRPVVTEYARGWVGAVDAVALDHATVERTTLDALELMTPGTFEDTERTVLLAPEVAAMLLEATARALLTVTAASRPELVTRVVAGTPIGSPLVTLVDDPRARGAYGGMQFDDAGTLAGALPLIQSGTIAALLSDRPGGGRSRRPGHVGLSEAAPSHLRMLAGTSDPDTMLVDGMRLEGPQGVTVSVGSQRVVLGAARARELRGGQRTGRVYADVELVGELPDLLAAIAAVGTTTTTVPFRDEVDGEPRWRSVEAPAILVKGFVRARRSRA